MPRGKGSLLSTLGSFIHKRFGVDIPASAWNQEALPDYLRMRLAIVDPKGREIAAGRDAGILREDILADAETKAFEKAREKWERRGLTRWDFGDLPEMILLDDEGDAGIAFPGLESSDDGVNLRLFKSAREAETSHRRGIVALYALHFAKEIKVLKRQITLPKEMKVWTVYLGGEKSFEKILYERTLRSLFDVPVRSEKAFLGHAVSVAPKILARGQEILEEITPLMRAYYETRAVFHEMGIAHRSGKPAMSFLAGIREELDRLVPQDFILHYEKETLPHLPRYLEALVVRAESGLLHLDKDREKSQQVRVFADALDRLVKSLTPQASEEKHRAIAEFRWMIEEYRVSVFAQKLKTAFPVSPKRLEGRLREIERMA
jgi:ATP-dependent helicase HrpA